MSDELKFVNRNTAMKLPLDAKHPILAPMDGVSDSSFRQIARRYGSGILYSEFVNGMDIIYGIPLANQKMQFTEQERPFGIQLFDDQPKRLLDAARIVEKEYEPDFIDINFCCPDRRVISRGAGAALLTKPEIIREMVASLVQNLHVPVTAKIRLGLHQGNINYMEIARIISDCGAVHLAVHARTADQKMTGSSNWEAIRQIKQSLGIPVIGNGDIQSPSDIHRMLTVTGCDTVMIGRGAIGNPWIFGFKSIEEIPLPEVKNTILDHLELSLLQYGPEKGLFNFRKHLKRYLIAFRLPEPETKLLLTCEDSRDFITTFLKVC